jgi:ABC-type antimicrobial peptide transport system permease subunit
LLVRDVQFGEYYWYFIFIGAWVTDTFAYFTGMLFGKHKLIPAVSPKKTVEGAIGGTVFCIAFFVGFGAIVNHFTDSQINLVLIAFAGLLSALVIYTLTNINISERNREIATLMVLGYNDSEVCMYIYREIYIMSFVGILLGIPLGVYLMGVIFSFLNFGDVSLIRFYVYILTPLITVLFSVLVSLLLKSKIVKINMNESLKSIE